MQPVTFTIIDFQINQVVIFEDILYILQKYATIHAMVISFLCFQFLCCYCLLCESILSVHSKSLFCITTLN